MTECTGCHLITLWVRWVGSFQSTFTRQSTSRVSTWDGKTMGVANHTSKWSFMTAQTAMPSRCTGSLTTGTPKPLPVLLRLLPVCSSSLECWSSPCSDNCFNCSWTAQAAHSPSDPSSSPWGDFPPSHFSLEYSRIQIQNNLSNQHLFHLRHKY